MGKKIYIADAVFCKRSDTLANWQAANPVLYKGEEAIIEDGQNGEWLKIGDGVTPFNDLPFKMGPVGPKGEKGEEGPVGAKGDKGDKGDKGEKGEKGDTYALTDSDKIDIAALVLANFTDVSEVGQ